MSRLIRTIKFLLYCLVLTPLLITPWTIFPFVFGRGLVIQFLIELIFALYLVLAFFIKSYRPKKSFLFLLLGVFLAVLLFSSLLGPDFNHSFWSKEERFTGWFYLFHLFLLFIVISAVLRTEKEWLSFFKFNTTVALAMFFVALLSLFGIKFWGVDLGTRISGTLGNPIFLASYFILSSTFSLYLFLKSKKRSEKIIWFAAFFIILYGIILTQSKGAWLGLIGGAVFGFIFWGLFSRKKILKIAALSFSAFIVLLASLLPVFQNFSFIKNNPILSRFSDISLRAATAKTRLLNWEVAWQAIKERPLLGWGAEGFSFAFNKYYNPQFLKYSYYETWSDKPHNKILEVAADSGVIGFLLYGSLFGAAFYLVNKKRKEAVLGTASPAVLLGGLIAYFAQNLFVFDTSVSYLLFFIFLAFLNSRGDESPEKLEDKKIPPMIFFILAGVLFLAGFFNFSPLWASIKLQKASTLPGVPRVNIEEYARAMRYFNPYKEEWRTDLAKSVISSLKAKRKTYSPEERQYALEELKKNIREHQNDAYYHMLLGGFYSELGATDEKYFDLAGKELDAALLLSPQRQHILMNYGRLYGLRKDKDNLIKVFEKAIALEPAAALSYWEGVKELYFLDSSHPKVMEWLIRALELNFLPQDDQEFLFVFKTVYQYFLEKKNYNVLSHFYERMQKIEPREAKWYAQSATARYLLGDKEEAIKNIRKAIELDESYRKEGEGFLRLIEAGK